MGDHSIKFIIIGGGITGLSAAWQAQKSYPHASITLFEKQTRLGGFIQTSKEGSYFFEKGPRTFQMSRSPNLLQLIQELDLEILISNKAAQRRFILYKNKLREPTFFVFRFFPDLIREFFVASTAQEDESIYDFAKRRFSSRIAECFFDPLTLGIYAGDIRKLSIRSCFPLLHQWEKEYGSILKALFKTPRKKGDLFTIRGGMQNLIEALVKRLNVDFVLNCEAEMINSHEVRVGSKVFSADFIIDATPPKCSKKSLWVVHLAYQGDVLKKKGFGYLIPSQEKNPVLGVVFDSAMFPEQNRSNETRLTAIVREEELNPLESAQQAIEQHLGITEKSIYQNAFFAQNAIPQFEVGCGQVAQISVDDCIERGFRNIQKGESYV